ncbi:MAG TPA: MarR family transcriptional regulator [Solirubrobacteraceae bacterium]|jgi:DNA-binding MarR family transcriptional regulator
MQASAAADIELATALDARLAALWRTLGRGGYGGLSRTAAAVLANLRHNGPQRITDLAAAEAVAQPSMTSLVTRLENAVLVRRVPDPDDARAVRVTLTPDGDDCLDEIRAGRAALIAGRLSALTAEERQALEAALPALDSLVSQRTHQ